MWRVRPMRHDDIGERATSVFLHSVSILAGMVCPVRMSGLEAGTGGPTGGARVRGECVSEDSFMVWRGAFAFRSRGVECGVGHAA